MSGTSPPHSVQHSAPARSVLVPCTDAGELADALADAIQDELEDLGGGDIGATHEDAVLQVDKVPCVCGMALHSC